MAQQIAVSRRVKRSLKKSSSLMMPDERPQEALPWDGGVQASTDLKAHVFKCFQVSLAQSCSLRAAACDRVVLVEV